MKIIITFTKQMIAATRAVAIMEMPEEIDNINKYLSEDSNEAVDLDLSLLDLKTSTQVGIALGMLAFAQKHKEESGAGK